MKASWIMRVIMHDMMAMTGSYGSSALEQRQGRPGIHHQYNKITMKKLKYKKLPRMGSDFSKEALS